MINFSEKGIYISRPQALNKNSGGRGRKDYPLLMEIFKFKNEHCLYYNEVNYLEDIRKFEDIFNNQSPTIYDYKLLPNNNVQLSVSNPILNEQLFKRAVSHSLNAEVEKLDNKTIFFF